MAIVAAWRPGAIAADDAGCGPLQQVAALEPDPRLVRYDDPGHGAAGEARAGTTMDDLGRQALDVLDAHGVERASFDARADLARVQVPVLVLAVQHDEATTIADARVLRALLPDVRLSVIPGRAHLATLACPDRVGHAIRTHVLG